jgi:hypothetical protein
MAKQNQLKFMKKEPSKQKKKVLPRAPKIFVEVTPEIIAASAHGDSGHCMIADAIKHARPDVSAIGVDIQTIRFTDRERGLRYTYLTPLCVQQALLDFDDGKLPESFNFWIKGAWVALASIGKAIGKAIGKGKPKKNRTDPALRKEVRARLKKAALTTAEGDARDGHKVPRRVGGKPLPEKPVELSRRREFGMRLFRGARDKRRQAALERYGPPATPSK